MDDIILLKPILKEKMWGGTRIFDFLDIPKECRKIGEGWLISALDNGDSEIINNSYNAKTLSELFKIRRDLFGDTSLENFPLLVKIIDADDDLSVQVHPNDSYRKGVFGKTECWYILDSIKNSKIIYGHTARNKDEFTEMIKENKWDKLLLSKNVVTDDFINVPAGTIHAINKGLLILEIQQSSDTTYRLYDYDRLDNGRIRDLHIDDATNVTTIPMENSSNIPKTTMHDDNKIITYISNEYFTVLKYEINGSQEICNPNYLLVTVIAGQGKILNHTIEKGMSFIIPSTIKNTTITGSLTLIAAHK